VAKKKVDGSADYKLIVWPFLKGPMQRMVLPNWLAITVGKRIYSWRKLDDAELAHEITHVRQWKRYGIAYPIRYWSASRSASKGGGDRYRDNRFEREAYETEAEVRKQMHERKS
jgi:hypothetical protein